MVFGRILGVAMALHVAARRNVAGLILVSPLTSLRDVARFHLPWLPVGPLMRNPSEKLDDLRRVEAGMLVIAAAGDSVVPLGFTEAFLAQRPERVEAHLVSGADHSDLMATAEEWRWVEAFLARLNERAKPVPRPPPVEVSVGTPKIPRRRRLRRDGEAPDRPKRPDSMPATKSGQIRAPSQTPLHQQGPRSGPSQARPTPVSKSKGRSAVRRGLVRRFSMTLVGALCLAGPVATDARALCGDAEPDPAEECDDGNTMNGDGCSAVCTVEAGFDCTPSIAGSSPENILVDGSFEDGNVGGEWTSISHSLFGSNLICGDSCLGSPYAASPDGSFTSGNYVLLAGGSFSSHSTGIATHAAVVIPMDATTLEFQWATPVSGPDGAPCAGATDGIALTIDGMQVWSNLDAGPCTNLTSAYERVVIDLATAPGGPYQGTSVAFEFLGSATGIPPNVDLTNVVLDDVGIFVPEDPIVPPTPSVCTAIVCGDSLLGSTEQCDDGNTASGDGCSATCEVEQPDFVCDDPVPPAASGEEIADGGLEGGSPNASWVATGTVRDPICSQALCGSALAKSGAFYAAFGFSGLPDDQTLTQNLTIASTATDLTFEMLIGACDSAADHLTVEIDGTEVFRRDCTGPTPSYERQSVPLGGFADGALHTLQFIGHTEFANASSSNIFVDEISILDNVAFAGEPGSCAELATACTTPEPFTAGIPSEWTVVNLGPSSAEGWGTSDDGICATKNWSTPDPDNNVTGGGGPAACADSDATGQIGLDTVGLASEMDTYLCSPAWDLTEVTDPTFSFLVNYQADDNDLNDNGSPGDPSDDFDDDFLRVWIGTQPPSALTLPGYVLLEDVVDHLDTTIELSGPRALDVPLASHGAESEAYVCLQYRATYGWYAQVDNAALRGSQCVPEPGFVGSVAAACGLLSGIASRRTRRRSG